MRKSTSRYAVFALGSSSYPDFCAFGKFLDASLSGLGCTRLAELATGDENKRQAQAFESWMEKINAVLEVGADEMFNKEGNDAAGRLITGSSSKPALVLRSENRTICQSE